MGSGGGEEGKGAGPEEERTGDKRKLRAGGQDHWRSGHSPASTSCLGLPWGCPKLQAVPRREGPPWGRVTALPKDPALWKPRQSTKEEVGGFFTQVPLEGLIKDRPGADSPSWAEGLGEGVCMCVSV